MDERKIEIIQLLYGLSSGIYGVKQDIRDLEKYKKDNIEDFSFERLEEMKILELLEKLGYPMNEVGTYLYKDMIHKVIKYLDKETNDELIVDLKNYYSSFYLELARFELDMGIKTFHQYIKETISKIDYTKIDLDIYNKIFENIDGQIEYGEQALIIGNYVSNDLKQIKTNNKNILKVKRLINTPYCN